MPKVLSTTGGKWVIFMEEFDITKMPFTSISRENWQMLIDLDADTLYDVIQTVGNYVLSGEKCECENTLSKVVCNQVISVIDRKGRKSRNSANNINKRWENKTTSEAMDTNLPTRDIQTDDLPTEVEEEPVIVPKISQNKPPIEDKEKLMDYHKNRLENIFMINGKDEYIKAKREFMDSSTSGLTYHESKMVVDNAVNELKSWGYS